MWLSVHLLDTAVSLAKMAELIEMPFGMWTQVGRRNHVLDEARIPYRKGTGFLGRDYRLHMLWLVRGDILNIRGAPMMLWPIIGRPIISTK